MSFALAFLAVGAIACGGPPGEDGADGTDGEQGIQGLDGGPGADGSDGQDTTPHALIIELRAEDAWAASQTTL
ncbi:MAG: hypothetical protein GY822_25800 [Deltaproteobacteria bacterium]|nr:hypothetical protein [Deltaproteobacteria bacterium]